MASWSPSSSQEVRSPRNRVNSTVPEEVTGAHLAECGPDHVPVGEVAYTLGAQWISPSRSEQPPVVRAPDLERTNFPQIPFDPARRPLTDGDVAIASSLAVAYQEDAPTELEVTQGQVRALGSPDARRGEGFQDDAVSKALSPPQVRLRQDPLHLLDAQDRARKPNGLPLEFYVRGRVRRDPLHQREPLEEPPDGQEHLNLGPPPQGLATRFAPPMKVQAVLLQGEQRVVLQLPRSEVLAPPSEALELAHSRLHRGGGVVPRL